MMLNCVFGGDGVGFINLIQYAILTVFLAGMMIGRTPVLGKKIEARRDQAGDAVGAGAPGLHPGLYRPGQPVAGYGGEPGQPGAHGFSEVLYAYTSGTANNGSAFARLNANTPFFNTTIGLAMLVGRYLTLLPMLARAGSLAARPWLMARAPSLPHAAVHGPVGVRGAGGGWPDLLPALALGPVVEHADAAA